MGLERFIQLGIDKFFKIWQMFDKYTAWEEFFWSVLSRIQTEYGKIRTLFKQWYSDPFQALLPFYFPRYQKSSGFCLFSEMGRNIRSQMLYRISALKYSVKLTGKQLRWSLFLNKVAGLQPVILLKVRLRNKWLLRKWARVSVLLKRLLIKRLKKICRLFVAIWVANRG